MIDGLPKDEAWFFPELLRSFESEKRRGAEGNFTVQYVLVSLLQTAFDDPKYHLQLMNNPDLQ